MDFLRKKSNFHNIAKDFSKDKKDVAKARDFASITIRVNAISFNESAVTQPS